MSWQNFCTDIESTRDLSKLFRKMQGNSTLDLGTVGPAEDDLPPDPKSSLKYLLEAHQPGTVVVDRAWSSEPPPPLNFNDLPNTFQYAERVFTKERVTQSINSFGDHKAPGWDEMAPIVVKNFNETSIILLISIYRLIIVTGYTPRNWRVNKMIFLAKPGKSDFSSAKSYRPITLSTTLLKIFERVLLWEMSDHIPKHLSNQYAFQACSSCEHAISRVVDVIEASLATRQVTVTLFLDIQGAFDNILFAPIIARLRHYGVPESLCRVIDYQLRNRLTVVKLGKTSVAGAPVKGTPQGGGPLTDVLESGSG